MQISHTKNMETQRHVVFRRKYYGNTASCSFYKTIGLPAVKFRKIFSEPNFCPPSTNLDKQNTVFIELRKFFLCAQSMQGKL